MIDCTHDKRLTALHGPKMPMALGLNGEKQNQSRIEVVIMAVTIG